MAGDWIKMRCGLLGDPAVKGIARRLNINRYEVVGRLHAVWSWADQNVKRNGNADGVTLADLDEEAGVTGFAQSMVDEGWLEKLSTGLRFPDFEDHNGKPAKDRAVTAKRVKRFRNDATVTHPLPEKRRVSISQSTPQVKTTPTHPEPRKAVEKPPTQPRHDPEILPRATAPGGLSPSQFLANAIGKPPNGSDHHHEPNQLDHDAHDLGLARTPGEDDDSLSNRIQQRRALDAY